MSNVRALLTFAVALVIVLLAIFQMRLRGYEEVDRIAAYVLYQTEVDSCNDQLYTKDDVEYRVVCENAYLLKSGLSEYDLITALEDGIVTLEDLEPYVTIE